MHAHRGVVAVLGLGLVGLLAVVFGAQTQPAADAGKAGLSPEQVFSRVSPAVVRIVVRDRQFKEIGLGSGFFVTADGFLVTNQHVVRGAEFATVLRADGSTLFVEGILALDADRDLALLKVNGTGLPCLEVAPDAVPPVGTRVYAIGNPQGLTNTLSEGLVSGIREQGAEVRGIQTTAAISPGSSGGPLVDAQGRVVGVTTEFLVDGQALNFAVPAVAVRVLLAKAATGKLAPLASAGGRPLDRAATRELDAAWVAMDQKRWSDALRILTGLKIREPDNPVLWFTLGCLHADLGNHELAVEAFKTAIRLKPDFPEAYSNLGIAYSMLGRHAEAVEACKTAIRLDPDYAEAYYNLGMGYRTLGRRPEAVEAFKTAIRLKPDFPEAYNGLGANYFMLGRYAEAVQACKTSIRLKPDYAEAYCNLGMVYGILGRLAEAVEAFKTAIRLKPDYAGAYHSLGVTYMAMGNRAEALRAHQALQRLDPAWAEKLRALIDGR